MKHFIRHKGVVAPLDRANIDTDAIIPKQFLKRIERSGFGQFLFYEWRLLEDGSPNPSFILNQPGYKSASVLLTRTNFGCGSSREHAPWAIDDYGFRVIIAPSFADIFYNNCFKNGILPVRLKEEEVAKLFWKVSEKPGYELVVDLEAKTVSDDEGLKIPFVVEDYRRECLMKGLDDIGITLAMEEKISQYEARCGIG